MTNSTELDAMARRYLDLWQEQWSSFASNPETATQMGRMMEMMAPASSMMSRMFNPDAAAATPPVRESKSRTSSSRQRPMSEPDDEPVTNAQAQTHEARAEATVAALQSVLGSLVELARRLDAFGQRLEHLEHIITVPAEKLEEPKKKRTVRRVAKRKPSTKTPASRSKTVRSSTKPSRKRKT